MEKRNIPSTARVRKAQKTNQNAKKINYLYQKATTTQKQTSTRFYITASYNLILKK
jgi:hypothetical protein